MSGTLTVRALFDNHRDKLELKWVAGEEGESRKIELKKSEAASNLATTSLVGYLNCVRPHAVQIIGAAETEYLLSLGKNSYADAIVQLFNKEPACVIIADAQIAFDDFIDQADRLCIPVFFSIQSALRILNYLQYYLTYAAAERLVCHGVFMEVMGLGVLISGTSGVGKSELALELISRGHRLIADDAPEFSRPTPEEVVGICPDILRDFLEVRGLGLLNIRAMFGDNAIKPSETLSLMIHLKRMSDVEITGLNRLQGNIDVKVFLETEIPQITLPVVPGSNLAVLVEGAVRNHSLTIRGYNASQDFIARQQNYLTPSKL